MTQLDNYSAMDGLGSATGQAAGAESSKRTVLQILWGRRLTVLLTTLVCVGGAFTYVMLATPIYVGAARIYVQSSGPKIIASDESGGASESRSRIFTECELIHSTPIMVGAMESPGVHELRTFLEEKADLLYLAKHLNVAPGKQDDLITISFESPYPEDIPKVLSAVYDSYQSFQDNRKKTTATEVMKILQREKARRETELGENLKKMLLFKTEHAELGFQGEKGNIIVLRLERLSTALTEAELGLVEAKSDYDALTAMKADPGKVREFLEAKKALGKVVIAGGTGDEDSRLLASLSELQLKLDSLKREYSSNNTAMQKTQDEIKSVRTQLTERATKSAELQMAVVAQQYQSAQDRMARIKASYDAQQAEAMKLNKTIIDYAKLESAYEQSRKLVETLDSRLKEVSINTDVGAMYISLIEPPSKPDKPVQPDKLRVMGIALGGGLLLGFGLALLRDWRDPRLVTPEQISATAGAPVVALLPELKDKRKAQDEEQYGRAVLQFPQSPTAEAYRGLRTTLTFGMPDLKARTILVTSPEARDGKSTLISNLAISMAQAGQRTLVLDADFRQPRQHKIFKLENAQGLSNVLQDGTDMEAAIVSSDLPGLDVLPAGPLPAQPSELLNSPRFQELLRRLGQKYDQILLDSPPVNAVSDSLILAARSDATLLVLRAEKSHRKMAEEARRSLASVGARVCGIVVNATPLKKYRNGYFSHYQEPTIPAGPDNGSGQVPALTIDIQANSKTKSTTTES